jgi:iron complex transport system substrate-binding protein
VAAVVIVAAVAVTLNNSSAKTVGPTDALGRTVSNATIPVRIVSCAPAITEMVYALGSGSSLVAVTDYCDYPSQVVSRKENHTVSSIGNYKNPNFDNIVAQNADLVILIQDAEGQSDMANKLDKAHIKNMVIFECKNITTIYANLELLGNVLHQPLAATEYVSAMKEKVSYIQSKVAAQGAAPKVMFAVYIPFWITGNATFVNDVMNVAGGFNAFGNLTGYKDVTNEAVLQADPDVIIVTATMMTTPDRSAEQIREDIISDPILNLTKAARSGKVFILMNQSEDIFLRPGIRITDGAGLLARMLYPTAFGGPIPYVIDSEYQGYLPSYN